MLKWDNFEVLTFDCFGTLIDWKTGIWEAIRPTFLAHGVDIDREQLFERYAEAEFESESEQYFEYRMVLRRTMGIICAKQGFQASELELESFVDSMAKWPAFTDSAHALRALQKKYKLAVISNVDDDLFREATGKLEVDFSWVITAQQARCYKPSLAIFQLAFERIGLPKHKILHIAQSLFHDIAPAQSLRLANVWVNRRREKHGPGATLPANVTPDWEVSDLTELVRSVGLGDL